MKSRLFRTTIHLALLVVPVVFASACGRSEPEGETGAGSAIPPADSFVPGPDSPSIPPEEVSVTERFRLPRTAHRSAGLREPMDLLRDEAGSLYVLDRGEPTRIARFDSTGGFAFHFGRFGQQVEIGTAQSFALSPWKVVLLVDRGRNTLMRYLARGTFIGETGVTGVPIEALPLPDYNRFYLHKWNPDLRSSYVLHMAAPLDSIGVTYGISIPVRPSVREEMRSIFFHTTTDRAGRLYVAFSDGYPVRVLTPEGETVRLVGIERRRLPKSPARMEAEREAARERLLEGAPDLPEAVVEEAAEPDSLLPIIEEIVVDSRDRLWVRTHRGNGEGVTAYDVFNPEGDFLALVEVPGRIRRTTFDPDGRLFVIDESSDPPEIVGYELRLGPPASP